MAENTSEKLLAGLNAAIQELVQQQVKQHENEKVKEERRAEDKTHSDGAVVKHPKHGKHSKRAEPIRLETKGMIQLARTLELTFNFGIKHPLFGKNFFWDYAKNLPQCMPGGKEVVEYLDGLMRRKVITTCTGIGRAFMFLALNEHELHNYLSALVWNKKLTQKYYTASSILGNEENSSMMLMLLDLLGSLSFDLPVESPALNPPGARSQRVEPQRAVVEIPAYEVQAAASAPEVAAPVAEIETSGDIASVDRVFQERFQRVEEEKYSVMAASQSEEGLVMHSRRQVTKKKRKKKKRSTSVRLIDDADATPDTVEDPWAAVDEQDVDAFSTAPVEGGGAGGSGNSGLKGRDVSKATTREGAEKVVASEVDAIETKSHVPANTGRSHVRAPASAPQRQVASKAEKVAGSVPGAAPEQVVVESADTKDEVGLEKDVHVAASNKDDVVSKGHQAQEVQDAKGDFEKQESTTAEEQGFDAAADSTVAKPLGVDAGAPSATGSTDVAVTHGRGGGSEALEDSRGGGAGAAVEQEQADKAGAVAGDGDDRIKAANALAPLPSYARPKFGLGMYWKRFAGKGDEGNAAAGPVAKSGATVVASGVPEKSSTAQPAPSTRASIVAKAGASASPATDVRQAPEETAKLAAANTTAPSKEERAAGVAASTAAVGSSAAGKPTVAEGHVVAPRKADGVAGGQSGAVTSGGKAVTQPPGDAPKDVKGQPLEAVETEAVTIGASTQSEVAGTGGDSAVGIERSSGEPEGVKREEALEEASATNVEVNDSPSRNARVLAARKKREMQMQKKHARQAAEEEERRKELEEQKRINAQKQKEKEEQKEKERKRQARILIAELREDNEREKLLERQREHDAKQKEKCAEADVAKSTPAIDNDVFYQPPATGFEVYAARSSTREPQKTTATKTDTWMNDASEGQYPRPKAGWRQDSAKPVPLGSPTQDTASQMTASPKPHQPTARMDANVRTFEGSEDFGFLDLGEESATTSKKATKKKSTQLRTDVAVDPGLRGSHNVCASCQEEISSGFFFDNARFCAYYGEYYCRKCHQNDEAVIPARVLHHWDFSLYRICRAAEQEIWELRTLPQLTVTDGLVRKSGSLTRMSELRATAAKMAPYIHTCKQRNLLEPLGDRTYLIEDTNVYSFQDLLDAKKGRLQSFMITVMKMFREHIGSCQICLSKGHICELCSKNEVIFSFQTTTTSCLLCKAVYHRECFDKPHVHCPKCRRIARSRSMGNDG